MEWAMRASSVEGRASSVEGQASICMALRCWWLGKSGMQAGRVRVGRAGQVPRQTHTHTHTHTHTQSTVYGLLRSTVYGRCTAGPANENQQRDGAVEWH